MEFLVPFIVGVVLCLFSQVCILILSDRVKAWVVWKRWPRCEHCRSFWGLRLEDSRTMYHYEGKWENPDNPNRPVLLCNDCAETHHEHWDDMWAEYYDGCY